MYPATEAKNKEEYTEKNIESCRVVSRNYSDMPMASHEDLVSRVIRLSSKIVRIRTYLNNFSGRVCLSKNNMRRT